MNFQAVNPSMRFDHLSFSNEVEDGRALSMYSNYTCPRCAEIVRFTKHDFDVRAQARFSNLPAALGLLIDRWADANGVGSQPFLDWLCPGCGLAVRAYARPWAGGRHGDYGTDITALVEVDPEERNAR